jgi:hypothetical protein
MMFNIKIEDRFRITRRGARILSFKLSLAAIRSEISAEYNIFQVISGERRDDSFARGSSELSTELSEDDCQ